MRETLRETGAFEQLGADPLYDEPLARYTTLRLGGRARVVLRPPDREALQRCVSRCAELGVTPRLLGGGSNLLIGDEGVSDPVLSLRRLRGLKQQGEVWCAEAGYSFRALVRQAVRQGSEAFAALAGIPGRVGGIAAMNAGGKYGCVADVIAWLELLEEVGKWRRVERKELSFEYRHLSLGGALVGQVGFRITPGDPGRATGRWRELMQQKKASQPLTERTAGCIFKNPARGPSAGALLDRAGCKGLRRGAASISTLHANFLLNEGGATASDALALIAEVRERVRDASGTELELELNIWQ